MATKGGKQISEFELVYDCINAIQGIEGKYIKWLKTKALVKSQADDEEFYSTEEEDEEDEDEDENKMEEEEAEIAEKEIYLRTKKLCEIERKSFRLMDKLSISSSQLTVRFLLLYFFLILFVNLFIIFNLSSINMK